MSHTFTDLNKALAAKQKVTKLNLNKQKGIKKLLKRLPELSNLTELTINSCTLSELPPEIGSLKKLKKLSLYNCGHRLKSYPPEIGQLSELEELHLGKQSMTTLPESIGNLSKLRVLTTSDFLLRHLPKSIEQLNNLIRLELPDASIEVLPLMIKKLTNLEHLNLGVRVSDITPFPDDFFTGFKKLKTLSLVNCSIVFLSKSITKLSSLEFLDLSKNMFLQYPIELLALKQLGNQLIIRGNKHYAYGNPVNFDAANQVKLTIEKYAINRKEAACYFGCLGKYKVDSMNSSTLLGALTQPELPTIIASNAIDFMALFYEENKEKITLKQGDNIAFLGKNRLKKKDLTICKNNNITILESITDRIPSDCSCLIVGEKIDVSQRIELGDCQLMTAKNFNHWLNDNKELYLLDKKDESIAVLQQNVIALLESGLEENINIALATMNTGGVPKNAITPLFFIAKTNANASIKRKAKKLLLPLLSETAKAALKIRGSFKNSSSIVTLIQKVTKDIEKEVNRDKIYLYTYLQLGKSSPLLAYLADSSDPAIRQVAWDHICTDSTMDLSYLDFNWVFIGTSFETDISKLQHIEEVVIVGNQTDYLPLDLSKLEQIKQLTLKNTYASFFKERTKNLLAFKNLKFLTISLIHSFEAIETVFQLVQLEELNLIEMSASRYESKLERLPKSISKFKKLKRLSINHGDASLENLVLLSKLTQLEFLSLASCPITELPAEFAQLQHLKTLDLRSTNIQVISVDLQEKLSNCTILL